MGHHQKAGLEISGQSTELRDQSWAWARYGLWDLRTKEALNFRQFLNFQGLIHVTWDHGSPVLPAFPSTSEGTAPHLQMSRKGPRSLRTHLVGWTGPRGRSSSTSVEHTGELGVRPQWGFTRCPSFSGPALLPTPGFTLFLSQQNVLSSQHVNTVLGRLVYFYN